MAFEAVDSTARGLRPRRAAPAIGAGGLIRRLDWLLFGALIALVATYRGFTSGRSAEAVGRATTSTVVTASVCILLADYIVTSLWEF